MHVFGHLVNYIVPVLQFTSILCLTNQLYPKNISIPFKSMTTALICSLCLLISTSSGTNWVTSPFFVPFVLKTLNDLSIGSVFIFSYLTSCLLIPVWVHLESTNTCNCNSFPFFVLMFVCTFNSLIVPTLNLWQNPSSCCHLLHLSLLDSS